MTETFTFFFIFCCDKHTVFLIYLLKVLIQYFRKFVKRCLVTDAFK